MEIRVEERLTGRELYERILERHGSREALEEAAARENAHAAQDDLLTVELLESDESRLDEVFTVETIAALEPGDVARLTEKRLELLEALATSERALNLTELAETVSRDPKNVSEDLDVLAELGLVTRVRRGREKIAHAQGREIHISLGCRTQCA